MLKMADSNAFAGRSVCVVNDLSREEQWYLYKKTAELKQAIATGEPGATTPFQSSDGKSCVYLIFMEDSTRTKESFRNAAEFHGMKVNMFDCQHSSFQKSETITDAIKMLVGYSTGRSTFVIRSKLEGVCRSLEDSLTEQARRLKVPRPSFLNAGDGRHEHPSQEFLDEFSFLEHKGWDSKSIHVALIGDLYHGRTVHSKVDGLKIYDHVEVDLIAPAELALPCTYERRMIEAGFVVRKFDSIAKYLEQAHVSEIWYFTRLQLERMGDRVLSQAARLREAVTFRKDFVELVPENAKFFHPLPRDSRNPELPYWLDGTKFNGWDQQSQNGFFTRIILLGMVSGHLGGDFEISTPRKAVKDSNQRGYPTPTHITPEKHVLQSPVQSPGLGSSLRESPDFLEALSLPLEKAEKSTKEGVYPIRQGIVIDHVAQGQDMETIWDRMTKVRKNIGLNASGALGVYFSASDPKVAKGLMTYPDLDVSKWDRMNLKKLAALAPGSTLNVIEESFVKEKFRLHVPPRIYNLPDLVCKNESCVSHPKNLQREVMPYFIRSASEEEGCGWTFVCKYCEHVHAFDEIWAQSLPQI